jgi:hypothetical protein
MESTFDPVWISSRDQLERFRQIRDATPWYRVFFGGSYNPPPGFPYISYGTQRFPIVYFSSGVLTVAKNVVTYAAHPLEAWGKPNRNLNTSLRFSIGKAERPTFLRYRADISPYYFSIDWIELTIPGRLLLLCGGGAGRGMGRIRKRTNKIFDALTAWTQD